MFAFIDMIITRPIANILFFIYNYVGDFGLAIILFVVLVKMLMWPLVKRQLYQVKLMRKLQPELAEIKKNCNGNRQLESLQTMDLYKRYNVKPFRSILSLLIQLPIFIALYSAIRVMAVPTLDSNLSLRAYDFLSYDGSRVASVIELQTPYLEQLKEYNAKLKDESLSEDEKKELVAPTYDFEPKLFNLVDLNAKAGFSSASAITVLFFSILAAFVQYFTTKQQHSSGKSKSKTFRQLMKEAAAGKEPDQAEINDLTTAQMGTMMPIMLLLIMVNLPGALVLYYLLSNIITMIQQKIVLKQAETEMEVSADRRVIKELKKIKEAEIIENKKTGTKITRISAKDIKKKRR